MWRFLSLPTAERWRLRWLLKSGSGEGERSIERGLLRICVVNSPHSHLGGPSLRRVSFEIALDKAIAPMACSRCGGGVVGTCCSGSRYWPPDGVRRADISGCYS